ncbi:MAG: hypothetical protein ACJ8C4_07495 [Gemmataceae bacterium]
MNSLIRSALGLGEASWPPDYYTLLQLSPETATPDVIESAVLDRMETLRGYQLAHPEPVTEAMNLLARALETLSDPEAKARYDNEPITPAPKAPEVYVPPPVVERVYPVRPPVIRPPLPLPPPVRREMLARIERPANADKRRLVRDLIAARRLLDAWDETGPYFSSPSYVPPSRLAAVEMLAALRRVASFAIHKSEEEPGGAIIALARSPVTTQALLEISEARRELLADDWRAVRRELLTNLKNTRRRVGHRDMSHRFARWSRRTLRRNPQTLAMTLIAAAVVVAICRWFA